MLDKDSLVGGCVRLPLCTDSARLKAEVANLPASFWGTRGGRVGVHNVAQAVFLRGYAPAEGDKPIEDREPLALLPYLREFFATQIPAEPLRCLIARLPPGAIVRPHVDRAPYFSKSLRLHFPVVTHEGAWMICAGQCYQMAEGEVWALNNSATHAVWNETATAVRTHIICDFMPSAGLLTLLARSDRLRGQRNPHVDYHVSSALPEQGVVGG